MDLQPVCENGIWKGVKVNMAKGYFKLGERILNQLKENPDFVGQIDDTTGTKDTYKSMADRSIRCALWLREQGINAGDIVGLCSKNHLNSSIPLYASLYLGNIFSPLSHRYLDEELLRHYLETRKPMVMFTDDDNADLIAETTKKMGYSMPVVIFGQKIGLLSFADILKIYTDEEVQKFICKEVNPEDPAIIVNTSGTTNLPKGVLHSYSSYANMLNYYQDDSAPSTIIGFYVISAITGLRTAVRSIIFKSTMIVVNNLSGEEVLVLIERYKVNRLWMLIYMALKLMVTKDLWKYDLSSVEMVTYGGGTVEKETLEFLKKLFKNAKFYPRYSGTEFGAALTKELDSNKLTSAGKVMANVEIKVVAHNKNKNLGPNEEGEIYCRTPKMMTSYWNNPEATAESIDSEGWYRTGDFGYYDDDGDFFINGRINELISTYAYKTLPSTIATVIKQVPGVDEVAVVAQPHIDYFEVPTAFITTVPGEQVTKDDVHEIVEKKLPDYMKIRGGVHFLETMPRTDSQKINTRELRARAKALFEKIFIQ